MGNRKNLPVRRRDRLAAAGAALAWLAAAAGCDVDPFPRTPQSARTFGEVIYRESCERVAYSGELLEVAQGKRTAIDASGVAYRPMCNTGAPPPAGAPAVMQAMASERQAIVDEVNRAVPEALLTPLDTALRAMVPSIDGPAGQKAVVGGGTVLLRVAGDPAAAAAIGRLFGRDGFRPPGSEARLALGLLNLPDLYATANVALPLFFAESDGAGEAPGSQARLALFSALSREVAGAQAVPNPAAKDRTLSLALRFLLTENAELRTLPAGQSILGVLRDSRGAAQVSLQGGALPSQFVDADKDGLPDLDADGRFKAKSGGSLPEVTPFPLLDKSQKDGAVDRDADGRALLSKGGPPLYRYINLDDTVLAALLREAPALLDPQLDIPLRMVAGVEKLLGPRAGTHKDYAGQPGLDYTGFDTTASPLLDLVYSYVQLLGYSDIGDSSGADMARLLRGLWLLLRDQESVVARSFQAMAKAFDEAKKPAYAAAALAEDATLYDDLAPVLVRMVRVPGLVPDVLQALGDPQVAPLGPLLGRLATSSSYVFMNQNQLDWQKSGAVVGTFGRTVNPAAPDVDVDYNTLNPQNNRSILQRVLHLVHDANGAAFCNKSGAFVDLDFVLFKIKIAGPAAPCELYKVDDLALYFLLSIADDSVKQNIPVANFLDALLDGTLHAGAVAAKTFGLLDNLLGIPGFSEYPKPQELARLLFQDNGSRADLFKTTLDFGACNPSRPGTLCCNQNHSWQSEHNAVLFALELDENGNQDTAATPRNSFYRTFRPIVNAFARHDECASYNSGGSCIKTRNAAKILVDLLSVLHRHWPTVEAKFYGRDMEPQSKKSGVRRYEPLISQLLGRSDLWASSLALAPVLSGTRVDDGSNIPLSTLVANFARWFLDPQALRTGGTLLYRDGRKSALRNDGQPTFAPTGDPVIRDVLSAAAQGRPTPYDLLAEAYRRKRAGLAAAPEVEAGWKAAVSSTADLYLSSQKVGAGYKFQNPRIRSIELALLELLRERVQGHGAAGDLRTWVSASGLPADIETALSGPVAAGLYGMLDQLGAAPEARKKVPLFLGNLSKDPGPMAADAARFRGLLVLTADMLQLLLDDGDVVPVLQKLGSAFDPASGALDGVLSMLRRGLPADKDEVLLQIGRNLFTADASGPHPAFGLFRAVSEIDRPDAGQASVLGSAFSSADYPEILKTVGQFLADHQRGVARIVDIVQSRQAPQSP